MYANLCRVTREDFSFVEMTRLVHCDFEKKKICKICVKQKSPIFVELLAKISPSSKRQDWGNLCAFEKKKSAKSA
jgi:hypothetical protein